MSNTFLKNWNKAIYFTNKINNYSRHATAR
jgi:hypothetical protein